MSSSMGSADTQTALAPGEFDALVHQPLAREARADYEQYDQALKDQVDANVN